MSDGRVFESPLTGRIYFTGRYKDLGGGRFEAITKTDVTADVEAIIAARLAALDPET